MLATSAAKSSSLLLDALAGSEAGEGLDGDLTAQFLSNGGHYFSTEILFSLTKACCNRQFSS